MDSNLKAAIREANRVLTANFRYERRDLYATLSFAQEPKNRKEAWTLCKKRLDKLRKIAKKNNQELRFWGGVSDTDGETGEKARTHIHICLGGVTMDQIREVWDLGVADIQSIRKEISHIRLAKYLLAQFKCGPNEKKWHSSRNLERTKLIAENEISGKYRRPKDAELIWQGEYAPEEGKLLDVQLWMPEKQENNQTKPATTTRAGGRVKNNKGAGKL